jgi:hypothetical protein
MGADFFPCGRSGRCDEANGEILMYLEFSWRIFEKYQIFVKIRHMGADFFPCGRSVRCDEANGRFSKLYQRAKENIRLMKCKELITGYLGRHQKHINTLCRQSSVSKC